MRKLSGGQRRRLDFALALAGDPELMFLDEPTTGFDPEARRNLWATLENLRVIGKTIVLTTHYLDEAERLADRVAILLDGRIKIDGSTREGARLAALPSRISFAAPEALRAKEILPPDGIELVVSGFTASCQTRTPAATLRTLLDWAAATGSANWTSWPWSRPAWKTPTCTMSVEPAKSPAREGAPPDRPAGPDGAA